MSDLEVPAQPMENGPDRENLSERKIDGAADHLVGQILPAVDLRASDSSTVNLADNLGTIVVFAYPEITTLENTTQARSFRDQNIQIQFSGADHIFGLSTQDCLDLREAASLLHLPYLLLSDSELKLAHGLALPTTQVDGDVLLERLTMILYGGKIIKIFYPVFPPDKNAGVVLTWLRENLPIIP